MRRVVSPGKPMVESTYEYDVFLSYASEDRDVVAGPLKERLEAAGIRVWFDQDRMRPGIGLATAIDGGLLGSRLFVMVLSPRYFEKMWTSAEKDAIVAVGRTRLVPLLHGLEPGELEGKSPLLSGMVCARFSDGLDAIVSGIVARVRVPTYTVYVVCPAARDAKVRRDVEEALAAAEMKALAIDPADGGVGVARGRELMRAADLTVAILAFRYGDPASEDEGRSTLELACDAPGAVERLVPLPRKGTVVDPETAYDQGPDGPDDARQARLRKLKRRVEEASIAYEPATLGSTLAAALRAWRKPRDPNPAAAAPAAMPPGFARDLDDYRRRVANTYGTIPLAGFGNPLAVEVRLEDLFVPLHARVAHERDDAVWNAGEAAERFEGRTDEVALTEAFWKGDAARGRRGLVLLGDPGSGKTTHLKRLLLWIVEKGGPSLGLDAGTVPLFLPLRALKSGEDDLRSFVLRTFRRELLSIDEGFVDGLLRHPSLLFLLDGLDEIFDEGARRDATRWIERLLGAHPDARFAVTCRYAGYTREVRLDGRFLELELQPLTKAQAETFVRNWYRIVEEGLAKDEEQGRARGEQRAGDLIELLGRADVRGAAQVFALTRNPLLLTAICIVHRDRGGLPRKRAALYDACVNVLLEGWRRSQGGHVTFTAADARAVLKPLAGWMHREEDRLRATAAELAPLLAPELRHKKIDESPEQFLRTIRDQSGLLTGWSGEQYGFMHLGFQEYLAALELRDRAVADPAVLTELAERFGDGWWREVTLLFLADGAWFTPFFRELVKHRAFVEHADLVQECITDTDRPSPDAFVEVLAPAREPEPAGDEERAFLAARRAGAAAALRTIAPDTLAALGWCEPDARPERAATTKTKPRTVRGIELVWIPPGTLEVEGRTLTSRGFWLGKYAITNEEYGRFLADADADAVEPRYWGDRRFNQPRQPVVGVKWHDAVKFCAWAGKGLQSEAGRLPTEEEWEYACRAGTKTQYWFGDDASDLERYAWFDKNSEGTTHPVGEKPANPFGLFDMHGNVWEWCADAAGPAGENRVIRGGSFRCTAGRLRSAYRVRDLPDNRCFFLGFRLAVSAPISG